MRPKKFLNPGHSTGGGAGGNIKQWEKKKSRKKLDERMAVSYSGSPVANARNPATFD